MSALLVARSINAGVSVNRDGVIGEGLINAPG